MKSDLPARREVSLVAATTLLAPVCWGTTYVTITEFLPSGRPLLVATMRIIPAGFVLVLVAILRQWRPSEIDWLRTAVLGLFNFGLFFPLLAVAVYRLPGGVAAAIGGLQPLVVSVLSWLVNHLPPKRPQLLIGILAAAGVGLVVMRPDAHFDLFGLLAGVCANVSFAIGVVLTKRFPAPTNRLGNTGAQLLIAATILIPLTLATEGLPPALSARNLVGIAYLSLIGTAFAFVLWFNGIRRLPAAAPPLLGLAAPTTGAVLGWVVLEQKLNPLQLIGFLITLGSIAYGASLRSEQGSATAWPPAHPPSEQLCS